MKRKFLSYLMLACTSASLLVACSSSSDTPATQAKDSMTVVEQPMTPKTEEGVMVGGANMVPSKNIVENAAGSADHTTLVTAVQAAGLAATLSSGGPFTVFIPTNAAFNNLPKGTIDSLLKPDQKEKLTSILTYHVISGALKIADLKDGQKLKTMQGGELTVSVKDDVVKIDGATITIPDVISANGVAHVIDAVLIPKK